MTASPQDPARLVVEDYLAALAVRLIGPRSTRAAVLEELRGGLHDATSGYATGGASPEAAARSAVAEFGTPEEVATALAEELGTLQARRTVTTLLLTGPLVGLWWLLLLAPSPRWFTPTQVWDAIPALPLVALGTLTGLAVLATTGRLIRWLPASGPHGALAGAEVVALACMAGDLAVLAMLAASPQPLSPALAGIAACASILRLACCAQVLRRCRRSRRSFPPRSAVGW